MFFLWGIGIPLTAFIILFKNKHRLDSPEVRNYYLMIYQGLKHKTFYWEFVNTTRKVVILMLSVILSGYGISTKAVCVLSVLILFYRLQISLEPYKYYMNNSLERSEMVSGAITLFGGLVFIQNDEELDIFNTILFLAIVIIN